MIFLEESQRRCDSMCNRGGTPSVLNPYNSMSVCIMSLVFLYPEDADTSNDRDTEESLRIVEALSAGVSVDRCTKQSYVSPLEVREHVRGMWDNQRALMNALFGGKKNVSDDSDKFNPADMFFLDVVPVPPSRFRPVRHYM